MANLHNAQMDDLGFTRTSAGTIRADRYRRMNGSELRKILGVTPDEDLIKVGIDKGVRSAMPVGADPVDIRPGDRFVGGPKCQLAASTSTLSLTPPAQSRAEDLRTHLNGLRELGFGQVSVKQSAEGTRVRLQGYILPGGSRTDMMIVLPPQFPRLPPIGFYLRGDAITGSLDLSHLFPNSAYHQAPNLSAEPERWRWYCLVVQNWNRDRHTLAGFLGQIGTQLANGQRGG